VLRRILEVEMVGRWPPAGGGSAPVDSQRRAPNLERCSGFWWRETNGFRNKGDVEFRARTGKKLKRLAARTAGPLEEMVMVVIWGRDKIRGN
jgi:hypothetical protein